MTQQVIGGRCSDMSPIARFGHVLDQPVGLRGAIQTDYRSMLTIRVQDERHRVGREQGLQPLAQGLRAISRTKAMGMKFEPRFISTSLFDNERAKTERGWRLSERGWRQKG